MSWGMPRARLRGRAGMLAGCALALAVPAAAHVPAELVAGLPQEEGELLVTGVLDGRRDRVDFGEVTLEVNGSAARLDRDGHFAVRVAPGRYYQLRISGPGVFTMVQTFGRQEVFDEHCSCLNVPAIELVARRPGRIELFFAGDTMTGRRFSTPRTGNPRLLDPATLDADLDALLAPMRPYFETADVASLNLESVLADSKPGPSPNKLYTFFSPTAFAHALKRNGIDHVSLGNNHTYDYLDAGLVSTLGALDAAGLPHSGAGMNEEEALRAARVRAGDETLAMLGFVGWKGWFEPIQTATEDKGGAAHGSEEHIRDATRRERRAGLVPVVQYHGSAEYSARPSEFSVVRMRAAIDAGAAVVSSHHPHMTQGLELYKDGLIAFSLGNFLFDQERSETQASFVMKVWLEDGKFLRGEVIPIQILDYRPVPAVGSIRDAVLRRTIALSAERGTYLQMSGGHAIVRPERAFRRAANTRCGEEESFRLSIVRAGSGLCVSRANTQVGVDLLMRGDFENATYLDAVDRSWDADNAQFAYSGDAGGEYFLRLYPEGAGKQIRLFPRPYMRRLGPGNYSLRMRVRASASMSLALGLKRRAAEGEPPSAAWRSDVVARSELAGDGSWQEVELDFSIAGSTEDEPWPTRPVLFFDLDHAAASAPVDLDDMAIIRWQPHEGHEASSWAWTHLRHDRAGSLARISSN